jgi:hypothetical protein
MVWASDGLKSKKLNTNNASFNDKKILSKKKSLKNIINLSSDLAVYQYLESRQIHQNSDTFSGCSVT